MLNFRPFFGLNLHIYMNFGVLHAPLPKKILHLVRIYDFGGFIENWQNKCFLMFFPLMREILHAWRDFCSLMWEILHACRESGRNSVLAGDSLSMRESWKP